MTVNELIEKLKSFPVDMQVVLPGYEGGYNDIAVIRKISIKLNVHKEEYNGAHEDSEDEEGVPVVELWGENTYAKQFPI